MPILEADGLVKVYGRRRVVDGVSLTVERGEIVGLLGPNGAGKTTSFKMICGLVKPDKGKVFLQDVDVTKWPLHERSRSGGMGYLPQQSSVFAKLSAEDNLRGMMQLLGFSRRQQKSRCLELLEQFKITHIRKSKAGTLSGGERRRLEIARCLVSNPKIIMLDEPFAGIDPVTVQNIQVVIKELSQSGISVLITDHAAREILQITDRTYVVNEGRILCSGSAEQIVAHDEVKKKYLGEIEMPTSKIQLAKKVNSELADSGKAKESTNEPTIPLTAGQPSEQDKSTRGRQSIPADRPVRKSRPHVTTDSHSEQEPDIISMVKAVNQAIDRHSDSKPETGSDRPKIVFSKPRRSSRNTVAPFKSTDLD